MKPGRRSVMPPLPAVLTLPGKPTLTTIVLQAAMPLAHEVAGQGVKTSVRHGALAAGNLFRALDGHLSPSLPGQVFAFYGP